MGDQYKLHAENTAILYKLRKYIHKTYLKQLYYTLFFLVLHVISQFCDIEKYEFMYENIFFPVSIYLE